MGDVWEMEGCGSGVQVEGRALEGGDCRPRHGKTLRMVAEGERLVWEARASPNRSWVKSFT